jgi:hypothetical protein
MTEETLAEKSEFKGHRSLSDLMDREMELFR